jgi:caa(3)-type oxidase subunit IV
MRRRDGIGYVVLGPLLVWAGLLVALAVSALYAFLGGPFALLVNLAIAAGMAAALAVLFMGLTTASALVRLTAIAGLLWLAFLFSLSFADYYTRRPADVPACQRLGQPCDQAAPRAGPTAT